MKRQAGILAVNRFEFLRIAARTGALARLQPAVNFSVEEVIRRYRGFDGLAWPEPEYSEFRIEDGLASVQAWPIIKRYVRNLPNAAEWDVILLIRLGPQPDNRYPAEWSHAGFDLGYFESPWSHFSVILHEVALGVHPELRLFASRLNEHLLLSTLDDALALLTERNRLAGLGKDLEQAALIEPISVYLPRDIKS